MAGPRGGWHDIRREAPDRHPYPGSLAGPAKAFTAASAKTPTLAIMENAQKNPGAANLTDIPGFLLQGGGVPVKAGDNVIGAIGVAGAPGGHLDAQCADEVLAANAALFQ
ncbi:heme-binding protein [Pseudomonas sp. NPDC077186]|uniref:heme-binding protein n=1 Tax=Pseudomonas sp. NPDC077186 TaxID=3364421 RepID=UPI0037C67DD6